ncbi:MAG: phosphoglucosamine mutase [Bacteroidales bacterium]|nr:phosphoglucosamine mutase [Bacteroidales bacterium]
MSLIKSISGIRGTIGGTPNDNLTPVDIIAFASAYGTWVKENISSKNGSNKIVVGRDARLSGDMVSSLVMQTLVALGFKVVNIGLATTPTTEIAVTEEHADGGVIITASHNPKQWNALKLLNNQGEFLNDAQGKEILALAAKNEFTYSDIDSIGSIETTDKYNTIHINKVLALPLVDVEAIKKANFTVAVDCVNSVGGVILPDLLKALGVKNSIILNGEPTGKFAHTPEPIPENLVDTAAAVQKNNADVCFVVDPDVDRLAIINEDGTMFGEEYTLVSVSDYVLQHTPGNTVSNLSSTRALADVTAKYGKTYNAAAVGEVNVVTKMKETNAVIGGEGNGGVIYPEIHYGRDALVGIALFLSLLAKSGKKCSDLRKTFPEYVISKNKIQLTPDTDVDAILKQVAETYKNEKVNTIDGVKIDFAEGWVHLRKSNTEPIIRIYAESSTLEKANDFAKQIMNHIAR